MSELLTDDDRIRCTEFIVGLMTPVERDVFEGRMLASPSLRHEVAATEAAFAQLNTAYPALPAPDVYAQIEKRLFPATARRAGFKIGMFGWLVIGGLVLATAKVALLLWIGR